MILPLFLAFVVVGSVERRTTLQPKEWRQIQTRLCVASAQNTSVTVFTLSFVNVIFFLPNQDWTEVRGRVGGRQRRLRPRALLPRRVPERRHRRRVPDEVSDEAEKQRSRSITNL